MRFAPDSPSRQSRTAARTPSRALRVKRAVHSAVETLEARRMLASVGAGEVGVYLGASGPTRINVSGSGSFDFVGASRDAAGQPRLNDIPMTVFDQETGAVLREVLGGYGGRDGIEPISSVSGLGGPSVMTGPDDPYISAPNGRVNVGGLAANRLGRTYGVNGYRDNPTSASVDILSVDNTNGSVTVVEDVAQKMLAELQLVNPEFNLADVLAPVTTTTGGATAIIGADFDPDDPNTLYFAVNVNYPFPTGGGTNATFTRRSTPAMFRYDLISHDVELDPGFFGVSDQTDAVRIDDFTFLDDGTIALFGSVAYGGGQAQVGLFFSDADNVIPSQFQRVTTGPIQTPTVINTLVAIEAIAGEEYIIAVTGTGNGARLLRIDLSDDGGGRGRAIDIGAAVDPDDDRDTRRGETIADLAFNPRITDRAFQPGKRGVLLGTDTFLDELVGIDSRERFQNPEMFAVYGNNVGKDTSIAISEFTPDPDTRVDFDVRLFSGVMNPYAGTAGVVKTFMGGETNLNLPNGGLFLGLRTPDRNNVISIPVASLSSRTDFAGAKPDFSLPRTIQPGVYISSTINDFLFAGTISGSVRINGSIDTFYAGNVLTGDIQNGFLNTNDNFYVNGDIRNLVVRGGIGTLAGASNQFSPGTDINVSGRIQAIKSGASFRGSISDDGERSEQTIGTAVQELETTVDGRVGNAAGLAFEGRATPTYLTGPAGDGLQPFSPTTFYTGETSAAGPSILDGVTANDSFDRPQVLGTYYSKARKLNSQVTVDGSLNNGVNFGDSQDFYGLPLLAGQTIQVGVTNTGTGAGTVEGALFLPVVLSVMDPDGRIFSQDISNQNAERFLNQRLSITANKPGMWRLLVSTKPINSSFTNILTPVYRPYTLTVDKAGDLAMGGLVSLGDVTLSSLTKGLQVLNGDLGAILATGVLEAATTGTFVGREIEFANPIISDRGNIRSIEGTSISRFLNNLYQNFPAIISPEGSVGLIRTTSFMYFNTFGLTNQGDPSSNLTIGGDYQVIETPVDFSANLSANGGIGVIRVGSWAQNIVAAPGYIEINADNRGTAEVGLVDVEQDFGTFTYGGPAIREGDGGNFRYLRVGGRVFRDYGSGSGTGTVLTGSNQSVRIQDDSGAIITIAPFNGTPVSTTVIPGSSNTGSGIPDPFGGSNTGGGATGGGGNGVPDPFGGSNSGGGTTGGGGNGVPDPFNGANNSGSTGLTIPTANIVGDLSVSAYPTRSSGSIIYKVESTTGIAINVQKRNGGASGDIGVLRTTGTGSIVAGIPATGPLGVPIVNPASLLDQARINPSRLAPLVPGTGTTLDILLTGARVNVFEIGSSAGTDTGVGNATGGFLNFSRIINNTDGEIVNLSAGDVSFLSALYLGVSRPVANVPLEGRANAADSRFGGIATSAPFNGQRNMIFVDNAVDIRSRGPIGNIAINGVAQNVEANSDGSNMRGVTEGIVGPIFTNGSIRNIDIGEGLGTSGSGDVAFGGIYSNGTIGLVTNENGGGDVRGDILASTYLEGIRLNGGGSIIDADIYQATSLPLGTAFNGLGSEEFVYGLDIVGGNNDTSILNGLGDIRINGTGGLLNARIVGYNMGRINVANTGFGMFGTSVFSTSGATMDGVSIGGLGIRDSIYSGGSFVGDVVATGTGKVRSVKEFSSSARPSESGLFDVTGQTPNSATDLNLYLGTTKKLTKISGVTNEGVIQDTLITAARTIDSVKAFEIRGVNTTGLLPIDDVYPMQINFADSIGSITTTRDINGLRAVGGSVGTISAGHDILKFQLQARNRVKSVSAGHNILGTANFNLTGDGSLDKLTVGQDLYGTIFAAQGIGSIVIKGDLGSDVSQGGVRSGTNINLLQVDGDVTGYVRANRTLRTLDLAGDVEEGATVRGKSITKQTVDGAVFGDIVIG